MSQSQVDSTSDQQPPVEDTTWANQYGAALKEVALRHGQQVFELTAAIGATQYAVNIIMRRVRGNSELVKAMHVLTTNCDNFARIILSQEGLHEKYLACKRDIETAQPPIQVAGSSIILPN